MKVSLITEKGARKGQVNGEILRENGRSARMATCNLLLICQTRESKLSKV